MKNFSEIPTDSPPTPLLDKLNLPDDIGELTKKELYELADEVREFFTLFCWSIWRSFRSWLRSSRVVCCFTSCF